MIDDMLYALFGDGDCQKHPKLLEMFATFEIGKNLLLNSKKKEFNKSALNASVARFKYIDRVVFLKALKDNLHTLCTKTDRRNYWVNDKLQITLHEAISFLEMKRSLKCLQIDSNRYTKCDSNLLNIEEEKFLKPKWTQSERDMLKQFVQDWLSTCAIDLAKFCRGLFNCDGPVNAKYGTDSITNLLMVNEDTNKMLEDLKHQKMRLQRSKSKLQFLTRECKENLEGTYDKLNSLALMQLEEEEDLLNVDCLKSRSDRLTNEQTFFQLQFFQDIYTQDVIAENENINLKLHDRKHHLHCQIIKAKHRLSEYEVLGPEFDILAQEHAALLEEMDIKRRILENWDVQE
ncbi:hypothetical protein CHUAL_003439 [Chamberlinius hualienensis]